jgi:hypothetical protein
MSTPSQGNKVNNGKSTGKTPTSNNQSIRAIVPTVIGLPPESDLASNMVINSMPILEIYPCLPNYSKGLTLFELNTKTGSSQYLEQLSSVGYQSKLPLQVAFQADSLPSLSINNEWGESFLQNATDVASRGAGELAFMTGSRTATEGIRNMANVLSNSSGIPKMIGEGINEGMNIGKSAFNAMSVNPQFGNGFKRAGTLMDELFAGNRIDFPHVWKGSNFSPSFAITVRLNNPVIQNDKMHEQYILAPLAALLTLGTPVKFPGEENVYGYPFLCKIKCKGLFIMNPAAISSMSVQYVDGMVGYNQRPSMIDVKIEFQSLYTSMISGKSSERPSIGQYLDVLREYGQVRDPSPFSEIRIHETSITTASTDIPMDFSGVKPNIRNNIKSPSLLAQIKDTMSKIRSTVQGAQQAVASARARVTGAMANAQSEIGNVQNTLQSSVSQTQVLVNSVTTLPKQVSNTVSNTASIQTSLTNSAISKVQNFKPRF